MEGTTKSHDTRCACGADEAVEVRMYPRKVVSTLSSTKEARIYNGKKTTSLTSGTGKTGQPPVKE